MGTTQARIAQIINNTNFGEIYNFLSQGRGMDYIAEHYHLDLALAWALRLEGQTDQEKFKELGWGLRTWGLRTWDLWNFNECDVRFGDDWPGRIPAQLVAHTLFYFTKPGDLVFDPPYFTPKKRGSEGHRKNALILIIQQVRNEIGTRPQFFRSCQLCDKNKAAWIA